MDYLAIKDLKKPKAVRERLVEEREIILTKDGSPFALLVSVDPDSVEEQLVEIRRALFSAAVMRARRRAVQGVADADIAREVRASRARRVRR